MGHKNNKKIVCHLESDYQFFQPLRIKIILKNANRKLNF